MCIDSVSPFCTTLSFLARKTLPALTTRQKQITTLVVVILSWLVTCYYFMRASSFSHLFSWKKREIPNENLFQADDQKLFRLAETLARKEVKKLGDGREMNKQQLLLEVLRLNPHHAKAYTRLGMLLPVGESIQLLNGKKFTQQELYLQAIKLAPTDDEPYFQLAITLSCKGSITLLDGTQMTQKELYLKTIELNPKHARAYYNLGTILSPTQKVRLPDLTYKTQRECYWQADLYSNESYDVARLAYQKPDQPAPPDLYPLRYPDGSRMP